MLTRTPISPRRVLLGSLLGLAIVLPAVYEAAMSGDSEGPAMRGDAAQPAWGRTLPEPPAGVERVLPPDAIPAIQDPQFVAAAQARAPDDAPMIAFSHGGETHAYSLRLLNSHEIVNDTTGGEPVAVTW